eukprot:Ihof_evm5s402 gene=Ihof_evmTU5s402
MVTFMCDGCSESLKKNKVDSHYACRNATLSCIDCNKTFTKQTYAAHTSCVTEAERYQGALYKGLSSKQVKKQSQQQSWLENVRAALENGTATDSKLRNILEKLADYENIPRKKAKFVNFCGNSMGVRDTKLIEQVFDEYINKAFTQPE